MANGIPKPRGLSDVVDIDTPVRDILTGGQPASQIAPQIATVQPAGSLGQAGLASPNVEQNLQNIISGLQDLSGNLGQLQAPSDIEVPDGFQFGQFNLGEIFPQFKSDQVDEAVRTSITEQDLSKLLTEQRDLRTRLLESQAPTARETELRKQLGDIRAGAREETLGFRRGVADIEARPGVLTRLKVGEERALETQVNLRLQTLASEELTLLADLGLEQEARQFQEKGLVSALGFAQEDINTVFKIQESIKQERRDFLNTISTLRTQSQSTLNTILSQFKGLGFDDLDFEGQSQLQSLANQSGIPVNVLAQGMEVVKNQTNFENFIKNQNLVKQDIANFQQSFSNTVALNNQFADRSKNFITIRDSFASIKAAAQSAPGPGDLAMIFSFMKVLDPTSVVRESEFKNAQKAASFLESRFGQIAEFTTGGRLSDKTRKDFLETAEKLFNAQLTNQRALENEFRDRANQFGLDPLQVAPNLSLEPEAGEIIGQRSGDEANQILRGLEGGELLDEGSGVEETEETEFEPTIFEKIGTFGKNLFNAFQF